MRLRTLAVVWTWGLSSLFFFPSDSSASEFVVSLNGSKEVPPNSSIATGSGWVVLDPESSTLSYFINYSGLASNYTASHIHGPAAVGVNAGVLFPTSNRPNGTRAGTLLGVTTALTATQITNLNSQLLYVNVHSTTLPGGEIRSQIVPGSGAPDRFWLTQASGDWNNAGNWFGGVPHAAGIVAELSDFVGPGNHTVFTDVPLTLGTLRFNQSDTYVVAGAGTLTLQAAGTARADVIQGNHKVNLPLIFASNTDVTIADGATLTIGNPATIQAGRTVTKRGNLMIQAPLTIEAGGKLVLASGPAAMFGAPNAGAGATVDVKNTSLLIDYRGQPSPAATIESQLTSGYNGGAWNGSGINTSSAIVGQTGLGWRDDPASQSILVKYTWNGDADLTGKVDANDYFRIDKGFANKLTHWINGDFDYSGKVDANDYFLIDKAFALQTGVLGGGIFAVPEPGWMLAAAVMGAMGLARGRRNGR